MKKKKKTLLEYHKSFAVTQKFIYYKKKKTTSKQNRPNELQRCFNSCDSQTSLCIKTRLSRDDLAHTGDFMARFAKRPSKQTPFYGADEPGVPR